MYSYCPQSDLWSRFNLPANQSKQEKRMTYQSKKAVVSQDSWKEKSREREEDSPKEELIKVILIRVDSVSEDVVSFSWIASQRNK